VVIDASARVAGDRNLTCDPLVNSFAPAGAPSPVGLLFPRLTPWATFCRALRRCACSTAILAVSRAGCPCYWLRSACRTQGERPAPTRTGGRARIYPCRKTRLDNPRPLQGERVADSGGRVRGPLSIRHAGWCEEGRKATIALRSKNRRPEERVCATLLSPLPGLYPLSASFSHGLHHGPHSAAPHDATPAARRANALRQPADVPLAHPGAEIPMGCDKCATLLPCLH
jgi:hypothetical protein